MGITPSSGSIRASAFQPRILWINQVWISDRFSVVDWSFEEPQSVIAEARLTCYLAAQHTSAVLLPASRAALPPSHTMDHRQNLCGAGPDPGGVEGTAYIVLVVAANVVIGLDSR
jgi:hypothetical protein